MSRPNGWSKIWSVSASPQCRNSALPGPCANRGGRRRFLHAKCYLVHGGKGAQLAFGGLLNPLIGIVGSSDFTGLGLMTNRELNLVHKTLLVDIYAIQEAMIKDILGTVEQQIAATAVVAPPVLCYEYICT